MRSIPRDPSRYFPRLAPSVSRPSKLRVLEVPANDAVGGTEYLVVMLAKGLRARDVDLEVALLQGRGPVSLRLREDHVAAHSLEAGRGLVGSVVRLNRVLRRGYFDIVNAYGMRRR